MPTGLTIAPVAPSQGASRPGVRTRLVARGCLTIGLVRGGRSWCLSRTRR